MNGRNVKTSERQHVPLQRMVVLCAALLMVWVIGIRGAEAADEPTAPEIVAERLYVPVRGPMMVRVSAPRGVGELHLVWMTPEGDVLGGPRRVRAGRVDLAEAFRDLRAIRRTTFVQVLADGDPAGPALVVQPMLSPLYAVTETAFDRDDRLRMRVAGWSDSPDAAAMERERRAREAQRADDEDDADNADANGDDDTDTEKDEPDRRNDVREQDRNIVSLDEIHLLERECSGFRLYVEQDVKLRTSEGDIRIALRPDVAPNTAWNFRELVRGGLYDGVPFHRIVPMTAAGDPFVIQAGDPAGDGAGGPGFRLPLEPSSLEHDLGVISMARSEHPDSGGSQFFICLSREGTARLDGQYCAFGYAVSGLEAIMAIADAELEDARRGRPVNPPVIHGAVLVDAPPREPDRGRPDERIEKEQPDEEPVPRRVPR